MRSVFILLFVGLGCGEEVVQTEACAEWVSCVQARDAQLGVETNYRRFDENGSCWGGAEGAALCDRSCEAGLEWMASAYDDLPQECL